MKESFKISETIMCKAIFPTTLNANQTLFGGLALQWMDEVAYISATRFTRLKMFTCKIEDVKFLASVPENSIIEILGIVTDAGPVRLKINVTITAESLYHNKKYKAVEANFIMVALNEKNQPRRIDNIDV